MRTENFFVPTSGDLPPLGGAPSALSDLPPLSVGGGKGLAPLRKLPPGLDPLEAVGKKPMDPPPASDPLLAAHSKKLPMAGGKTQEVPSLGGKKLSVSFSILKIHRAGHAPKKCKLCTQLHTYLYTCVPRITMQSAYLHTKKIG